MIDLMTINAWLDTKAGAGKTTEEAIAFLTEQETLLESIINPIPVFDKVAYKATLKNELKQWNEAVQFAPEIRTHRIKEINDKLNALKK